MANRIIRSLFCFFCFGLIFCIVSSYSQLGLEQCNTCKEIRIPLDKQRGIPFIKGQLGEYIVKGFDIDSDGNYYFLGGEKATLACFSKYGKSIYRKSFFNLTPSQTYILGEKLYLFEIGDRLSCSLVEINRINGLLIQQNSKTIKSVLKSYGCKQISYYEFRDSILRVNYIDSQGMEKTKTKCFNLKGELLPNCSQSTSVSAAIENENNYVYLGKFGNKYVLGKYDDDGKRYDLSLRDSSNAVIADTFILRKNLREALLGDENYLLPDHIKVKNNKLYRLYRDKNMAVITSIDLGTFFNVR